MGLAAERPVTSALKAENLLERTSLLFVQSLTHNFIHAKPGFPVGVLLAVGQGREGA